MDPHHPALYSWASTSLLWQRELRQAAVELGLHSPNELLCSSMLHKAITSQHITSFISNMWIALLSQEHGISDTAHGILYLYYCQKLNISYASFHIKSWNRRINQESLPFINRHGSQCLFQQKYCFHPVSISNYFYHFWLANNNKWKEMYRYGESALPCIQGHLVDTGSTEINSCCAPYTTIKKQNFKLQTSSIGTFFIFWIFNPWRYYKTFLEQRGQLMGRASERSTTVCH